MTRSGDIGSDLVISLVNSASDAFVLPASVTIPAGQSMATFNVSAVSTRLVGDSVYTAVVASATSYQSATNALTVLNNNVATLTVDIQTNSTGARSRLRSPAR